MAEGELIRTKAEFWLAVDKLSLPVVAKPDSGVGSAATFMIHDNKGAKKFEENYDESVPYFIEQAIQSDRLGSYDGLIDQDGNIVWDACLTYNRPTLEFIDNQADMAYVIHKEIDPKLVAYGNRIVKEFGMKERFFHIEFFKMPDDDYIVLEYNNRIAGNFAVDLYNFAHSINLFKEYANIVIGEPFEGNHGVPLKYCIGITQRKQYEYVHNKEAILNRYGGQMKHYEKMPEAFSELMGNDFYAITADTKEEINEIQEFIHRRK